MRVDFSVSIEPEELPVEGNVDDSLVDEIMSEACHNPWAWCVVTVTASNPNLFFTEDAVLGCCSYKSLEDFKSSDYYDQMCREAEAGLMVLAHQTKEFLNRSL